MHARYQLEDIVGAGGMGVITRAYDRLTNTWVALKQLTLELEAGALGMTANLTPTERTDLRLALAEEFRLLATLRHPHIVSVLDYGFGQAAGQEAAFFTMEYLVGAAPFAQAAQGQPLAAQMQLVGQLLQALEYVRRHQVVHRDLKPDNVLVQQGQVKILDFGLAAAEGQHSTTMGSLFYMAPESFRDQRLTHATDLFAVGVMAYEVLAGQPPFMATSLEKLVAMICQVEPDYTRLAGPVALRAVIARLLAKDPAARYASAAEALAALADASGVALPLETQATRVSLLQAARFVGREAELGQLTAALTQAQQGHGSAWLLGGESGVGKSRLLEELRIQGLVHRAWVWHGQAVSEGGVPAQLWRNILRWLALTAAPSDLEAAVLQPFVPQLAELLGRAVPEAPALEAQAARDRFCGVVLVLLRRVAAQQPIVLILEDLHWAGPFSRAILAWVMRAVSELPMLIVGTYRNDEQPHLPNELPAATCLALQRLTATHIKKLTSAILGLPADHLAHLTEFLFQQTEGNALFVVEGLRSLAEEAGLLSQVQAMELPEHLLVGGMQQVIQRRLKRISPQDYPWLELAALAGRELDIRLLHALNNNFDWNAWLSRCAEAAVLEPQGAAWRFAHDQLRQGLLTTLPAAQARALHQTLAEALEAVYARNLTPHLDRLAHHYTHTDQVDKQRHYLQLAGQAAQEAHDYAKALTYYAPLMQLGLDADWQIELHLRHGLVLERLGHWPAAEIAYQTALTQSQQRQDAATLARSQKALGTLARLRGNFAIALTYLQTALQAAEANANQAAVAQIQAEIGAVYARRSDYPEAKIHLELGVELARLQQDAATEAFALGHWGYINMRQGDFALAQAQLEESLALCQRVGDKPGIAWALNYLASVKSAQKEYAASRTLDEASLALRRELGDKEGVANGLNNLGYDACEAGDYAQAQALFMESLTLYRELGGQAGIAYALENLGLVAYLQGADYAAAARYFAESLALSQNASNNVLIMWNLAGLAACYIALGQAAYAVPLLAAAENLRRDLDLVLETGEQRLYEQALAAGQAALSAAAFEQVWARGTAMPLTKAIALALADNGLIANG